MIRFETSEGTWLNLDVSPDGARYTAVRDTTVRVAPGDLRVQQRAGLLLGEGGVAFVEGAVGEDHPAEVARELVHTGIVYRVERDVERVRRIRRRRLAHLAARSGEVIL